MSQPTETTPVPCAVCGALLKPGIGNSRYDHDIRGRVGGCCHLALRAAEALLEAAGIPRPESPKPRK